MKIIMTDYGGLLLQYIAEVRQAALDGTHVVIKGLCASACTLWLGLPTTQICVYPEAWIGFHKSIHVAGPDLSDMWDNILWSHYPEKVKIKLGHLTREMKYLRGRDTGLPLCQP